MLTSSLLTPSFLTELKKWAQSSQLAIKPTGGYFIINPHPDFLLELEAAIARDRWKQEHRRQRILKKLEGVKP